MRSVLLMTTLLASFLSGCSEDDSDTDFFGSGPSSNGQSREQQNVNHAGRTGVPGSPLGSGDLTSLGENASANQASFREHFGLSDPTQEQMTAWQQYDARFTEYSDKDHDWPRPTVASANWQGSVWSNGDPLALEGTTVAVDFNRIPRGSLIYIPSLNMYAEANDTGATGLWSQQDYNQSDYGPNGAGRVDIYNSSGDRSALQTGRDFSNWIGGSEYGSIYVVYPGSGWKQRGH
jgi:3D (Asp-Asp-Asp) domain-containing protein